MRRLVALLAILVVAQPAPAWNGTGHRIVAAIAYDALTPSTRARVDDLLRRHPDYSSMFLRDAPSGPPAARARAAFIAASTWADQIKSDSRFYDDDRREARPTPLLRGYPDMARHQYWHFVNLPFTQDGTRLRDPRTPHIVTEIQRLSRALAKPVGDPANPVYALPWLLHLVGDLHNPLHAATRFTRDDPNGDRGGNAVYVDPGRNLHSYWDGLAGSDPSSASYVDRYAERLGGGRSGVAGGPADPALWAQQGVEIAKEKVYRSGGNSGTENRPIRLSREYQNSAKQLAEKQLYLAGVRLATLLNGQIP
ncbi:MAG: S1/P1 nuclease [Bryobacteraceae bacterium]